MEDEQCTDRSYDYRSVDRASCLGSLRRTHGVRPFSARVNKIHVFFLLYKKKLVSLGIRFFQLSLFVARSGGSCYGVEKPGNSKKLKPIPLLVTANAKSNTYNETDTGGSTDTIVKL